MDVYSSINVLVQFCVCCLFQTERDVSVRQRAVDLLYAMCDRTNAEEIVGEMLEYLETADYSIREEMVSSKNIHYIVNELQTFVDSILKFVYYLNHS